MVRILLPCWCSLFRSLSSYTTEVLCHYLFCVHLLWEYIKYNQKKGSLDIIFFYLLTFIRFFIANRFLSRFFCRWWQTEDIVLHDDDHSVQRATKLRPRFNSQPEKPCLVDWTFHPVPQMHFTIIPVQKVLLLQSDKTSAIHPLINLISKWVKMAGNIKWMKKPASPC